MTRVLTPETFRCPTSAKRCYVTEQEATAAIERAWARPDWQPTHGRMPRRAFLCDCGFWHMATRRDAREETAA